MPEGNASDTGKWFAAEMQEIRNARGISLDRLHDETKIPRGLIASFEETGLFDHPMFNRVYLRSFVRTYAEVLGISPDVALASLEEALDGTYRGALGVEYLGKEPPAEPAVPPVAPSREETMLPAPSPISATTAPEERTPSLPAPSPPEAEIPGRAAPVESDWTASSPPPGQPRASARSRGRSGSSTWLYALIGVVVLGVVAWLLVQLLRPSGPNGDGLPASADSVASAAGTDTASAAPDAPALRPVALGDTLFFTVIAASDKVDPIRITRDRDLRRPYWIEQGQASVFPAQQRIVLEEDLDDVRLLVNGYEYPTSPRDSLGRLVITREAARDFLSRTSGSPVRLDVQPETLWVPVSQP